MKEFFKKYPIAILFSGFIIISTVILAIAAIYMKSTVEIELRVAPASATILIDGKQYQNGTFRITPGDHTISIKKDNFTPKEYTFNTDSTNKIFDYLLQVDGGYDWYLSHPEDAELLTSIGDYESDIESSDYNSEYPIVKSLPIIYAHYDENYNYTEYRIDGGSFDGCNTSFCLKVTDTTGGNLDAAKQKIIEAGYNPSDFQILYEYTPIQPL